MKVLLPNAPTLFVKDLVVLVEFTGDLDPRLLPSGSTPVGQRPDL